MANQCVEYKLHRNDKGQLHIPTWIEDPGYYYNPTNKTFIGFLPENPDWYIPNTVVSMPLTDFLNRGLAIHKEYPELVSDEPDAKPISAIHFKKQLKKFYIEKTK
jgi:hypothetical protein